MPRLSPLPNDFTRGPFRVSDALAAGIGVGRLSGPDLERPFHGVRRTQLSAPNILDDCRAFATRLRPGWFFSHLTAALLHGLPVAAQIVAKQSGLHVCAQPGSKGPRGRGVIGHRASRSPVPIITLSGLPVATAAALFVQCAAILPLDELVVLGDAIILDPEVLDTDQERPLASIEDLRGALPDHRVPGRSAALDGIALTRQGAESRTETLLRLLLVRSGLPEPVLGQNILDARGRFVARVDLCYPEWRVIVEYDGDQHRTSTRQYERDLARLDALRELGWRIIGVRSRGLFVFPERTVASVRRALETAGWRP